MTLVAPLYMPATAYEAPTLAHITSINVDMFSVTELRRSAAAWAIVLKHAPAIPFVVDAPALKRLVSNLTVSSFVNYGVITSGAVDQIDMELRRLSANDWPAP